MTQLIYAFKNPLTGFIKVGISKDPEKRKRALETASGCALTKVFIGRTNSSPRDTERDIHKSLAEYRQLGEWFNCSEATILKAMKLVSVRKAYKTRPHTMNHKSYHIAEAKRFKKGLIG